MSQMLIRDPALALARDVAYRALTAPLHHKWQIQGLGMLRTYLDDAGEMRLHVWDSSASYVKDSNIHTHPWGFDSRVLSGVMRNRRFLCSMNGWGHHDYMRQKIVCGPGGCSVEEPEEASLVACPWETYGLGAVYSQSYNEIHESNPDDGTVTLIRRIFREDRDHAFVFYPVGSEWTTAEARTATDDEILRITRVALTRWQK